MAMLGMQADMQCNYFSRYATTDRNLNDTCSTWPLNNVDRFLQNGHCNNGGPTLPPPLQHLACKEVLKQTILHHEAIFRNQILELHRLYNRQRELMDEMKKNDMKNKHHLWLQRLHSSPILTQNSLENSQKTCQGSPLPWMNSPCGQSTVSGAKNNPSHLSFVQKKVEQAVCNLVQTNYDVKEPELLQFKCKKVGNKILDLELPAEEYIDIEEESSMEKGDSYIPEVPTCVLKGVSEGLLRSDGETSHGSDNVDLPFQEDTMNLSSFSAKTNGLADLNEPIKIEEETDHVSMDLPQPVACFKEIPCLNSDLQFELQDDVSQKNEEPEADSNVQSLDKNEIQEYSVSGQSSSDLDTIRKFTPVDSLSISSDTVEVTQAKEISSSDILDQSNGRLERKRKVVDLESCESDATSGQYTLNALIPLAEDMKYEPSLVTSRRRHMHNSARAPIVVQALPCFSSSVQLKEKSKLRGTRSRSCHGENDKSSPKFHADIYPSKDNGRKKLPNMDSVAVKAPRVVDLNATSPSSSSEDNNTNQEDKNKALNDDLDCFSAPAGEELHVKELVVSNQYKKNTSGCGFCIDLNSCVNEDDFPTELDLEAPASPENKESSPPRGESDENQMETPSQVSGQDDTDLLGELGRIAAEAIISISSSQDLTCLVNAIVEPVEMLPLDSFCWFARIVSSVVDDQESEFGVSFRCNDGDNQDEFLSDGIDYFEAMTLALQEAKIEDCYCYCETHVQEQESRSPSASACQPRKGRTRRCRQQRKDFQSEILPSLASLSRYEVTEDLQAIGGVTEATRTRRNGGSRKALRNGSPRLRRGQPAMSPSAGNAMCLEKQTKGSNLIVQMRNLVGWSMITRRRTGQRCRGSNDRVIVGQA